MAHDAYMPVDSERKGRENYHMSITRKLGVLVFFGVPAIIGGGIVYHFFHDYTAVVIYEMVLLLVAGGFFSK